MKCDFCSDPNPVYQYAAPVMDLTRIKVVFAGGHWAACVKCGVLLEQENIPALIQRCVDYCETFREIPQHAHGFVKDMLQTTFLQISRVREPLQSEQEYLRTHAN